MVYLQKKMTEQMPRIGESLKGELLQEHSLKPTAPAEKNILPSAEDVKQEKTHQNILSGWCKDHLKRSV